MSDYTCDRPVSRCIVCDRPMLRLVDAARERDGCIATNDPDCLSHAVDWRKRAMRAERFAAAWKESARSNRIGFGWWNACHDKNWTDESDICRTLLTRYGISTYVERSPDAPHGGGYFTSFDDRRKAIFARIDADLASAYARGIEDAAKKIDADGHMGFVYYAALVRSLAPAAHPTKEKERE